MRPQEVDGRLADVGQEWGPFGAPALATAYAGCVPAEFRLKPSSSMLTDADGQGNVRTDTVSGQRMLVRTPGWRSTPGPGGVARRTREHNRQRPTPLTTYRARAPMAETCWG